MEKRTSAISVRFTDQEKQHVIKALSQYGDIAVSARMILIAFADGHKESGRMAWPPESTKAAIISREEIQDAIKQLIAAEADGPAYKTKREKGK